MDSGSVRGKATADIQTQETGQTMGEANTYMYKAFIVLMALATILLWGYIAHAATINLGS